MSESVACPCCGYTTLPDGPGAYEVCEVCSWEDDGVSTTQPLVWGQNPNGITLAQGQRRYRRYGTAHLDDPECRLPRPEEARDPGWRPAQDPDANQYQDFVRDLTHRMFQAAHDARDLAWRQGDERTLGHLEARVKTLELLLSQAAAFDMGRDDIGLPDMDLATDFPPTRPTNRYAG